MPGTVIGCLKKQHSSRELPQLILILTDTGALEHDNGAKQPTFESIINM